MGAWALGFLVLSACSGQDGAALRDEGQPTDDAAVPGAGPPPEDAGVIFHEVVPRAGADDAARPVEEASVTPDGGAPSCIPDPAGDEPDDDFLDTNCDGIDGDASHAIFVAPTGSDDAAGDRQGPVATLTRALELARAAKKDVYVCNGTYADAVSIVDAAVSVYGGYVCQNAWRRIWDRPVVAPTTGPALTVRNLKLESCWTGSGFGPHP